MIKEAYKQLRKEHPILPEFDTINKEFEIARIETDQFLLKDIKKKIAERFEPLIELFEHTINPDPNSFIDMTECRCFTDGEKKQVLDVFRHLMEQYRSLLETDLVGEDEVDAQTIQRVYGVWMQDKKQMLPFLKKIRECWQKHVEPKKTPRYLG